MQAFCNVRSWLIFEYFRPEIKINSSAENFHKTTKVDGKFFNTMESIELFNFFALNSCDLNNSHTSKLCWFEEVWTLVSPEFRAFSWKILLECYFSKK